MRCHVHIDFFKDYPAPTGDTTNEPIIAGGPAPAQGGDGTPLESFVGAAVNGTEDADTAAAEEEEEEPKEDECEAVKEWRRTFAKGLEEKLANERKVKAERVEQARSTLTTLNKNWNKKIADTKEANRGLEKEFLRDRDALLARMSKPGEQPAWSVIPELVDMSGKFKEGARDTSRMRQVLMKMKTY